jgi:hypothetical protein
LKVAHEFLNNKARCNYTEEGIRWAWRWQSTMVWPYFGDCSGTVTDICFRAKCNDPNGLNWSGGNTASILSHAKRNNLIVTRSKALTCDFVLFGMEPDGYTPKHVVMLLQPGTVNDPNCFSMGTQGDPSIVPLSILIESIGAPIFVHNHTDVLV